MVQVICETIGQHVWSGGELEVGRHAHLDIPDMGAEELLGAIS